MKEATRAHNSIRLFKNPLLEALTHVHPSLPFIIWIPVIVYLLYGSIVAGIGGAAFVGYLAGGLFLWTLTEYGFHRYVFHFKAKSKAGQYLVFLFHGIHHDDPQDPTRLVMPPVVSITLGSLFYLGFVALFGEVGGKVFFSGFMIGYLIYDYIHFATHHFRPRTEWGKRLKDNHMKHHFVEKGAKWGVSSPLWDYVFGTFKQN